MLFSGDSARRVGSYGSVGLAVGVLPCFVQAFHQSCFGMRVLFAFVLLPQEASTYCHHEVAAIQVGFRCLCPNKTSPCGVINLFVVLSSVGPFLGQGFVFWATLTSRGFRACLQACSGTSSFRNPSTFYLKTRRPSAFSGCSGQPISSDCGHIMQGSL